MGDILCSAFAGDPHALAHVHVSPHVFHSAAQSKRLLAPSGPSHVAQKDWASGHRFIEYIMARCAPPILSAPAVSHVGSSFCCPLLSPPLASSRLLSSPLSKRLCSRSLCLSRPPPLPPSPPSPLPSPLSASDKLQANERWIFEGLMAIRGQRNGVFFADAIAILVWLDRGIEYLQRQEDLAGQAAGGGTRRQLLAMAREPAIVAVSSTSNLHPQCLALP